MTCLTAKPNGQNIDCNSFLKEAVAIAIADAGTLSFDNGYALDNAENWRVKIQEEESLMIIPINGTEVTPAEAREETTGNGTTIVTGENAGSVITYMQVNPCDFNEILRYFKGGTYDLMYLDADNNVLGHNTATTKDGYLVQLHAPNYGGVGSAENQVQQYKLMIKYLDPAQQNSPFIHKLGISLGVLKRYSPIGMTINESTAYVPATGVLVADIFKRCTNTAYTSTELAALAGEVIAVRGQADASGVTVVPAWNAATLKWDITVADGIGQIATGASVDFRVTEKSTLIFDYASNVYTVNG